MALAVAALAASVWKQFARWRGCRPLPLPAAGRVTGPCGHGGARWWLLISTGCGPGQGAVLPAPNPYIPTTLQGFGSCPCLQRSAPSRVPALPGPQAALARELSQGELSTASGDCRRLDVRRGRSSAAHSHHSARLQSLPVCKQPWLQPSMSPFFPVPLPRPGLQGALPAPAGSCLPSGFGSRLPAGASLVPMQMPGSTGEAPLVPESQLPSPGRGLALLIATDAL